MSGAQRLDVEFSRVKELIQAQSGRFEFLKQALTLSSAGLAGFSIFFTEPDRTPDSLLVRVVIILAGIGLLFVTGAALSGIGSYANFLRKTETETRAAAVGTAATAVTTASTTTTVPVPTKQSKKTAEYYRKDVVMHANCCLVGLFITGIILMVFAGLRIFSPDQLGPEQALHRGREIIRDEVARPGQSITLDSFNSDSGGYSVKFVIEPSHDTYLIKLKKTGRSFDIARP